MDKKTGKKIELTDKQRLQEIANIIESVDTRCMAVDGPVTATLNEMTQKEISRIYDLATGFETQ